MTRQEMLEKMQNVKTVGSSKLHMRSENLQQRHQVKRLPQLKKGLKKKSKILLITELAVPFNPETGVADDNFNEDSKFRPALSASTVALMLKHCANQNADSKDTFMRRAGVTEWDTSDENTLTDEDVRIFKRYRVPRIFTVPVVHVNIKPMTRNDFGRDYAISVEYDDDTGEIVGEVPGVLKVNKLFRDKIYEEIKEYQNKIDKGELHHTEKQQKEYKSNIYKKNPVSDVQPSNWVTMIELPLTPKYDLSSDIDYKAFIAKTAENQVVISRLTAAIKTAIGNYTDGSWEKWDHSLDYLEFDMNCPSEGDESTQEGKMDIGRNTNYEKPTSTMPDLLGAQFSNVSEAIKEYLDNSDDIESEVRRSIYTPPYTPEVESQIYATLPIVLDIENDKYLTQKVISANSEVMALAFGDAGMAKVDDVEAGVSDAIVGALDEAVSKSEAKQYSVESLESEDEFDVDSVDFDA